MAAATAANLHSIVSIFVKGVRVRLKILSTWALAACVAGCAGGSDVPVGQTELPSAPQTRPVPVTLNEYLLGPLDTISVNVFNEPTLSVAEAGVSLSGKVSLPLLGEMPVSGRSTGEVATMITSALNARYLRNARVSVSVERAANFTVTIDGEVKKPGVYQIPGARLTLVQAIALGEGVSDLAKLDEILIIREIEGKRYVARFDLAEIRAVRMIDPQIQQGDIIVVGYSRGGALTRTLIGTLPGVAALFVALRQ